MNMVNGQILDLLKQKKDLYLKLEEELNKPKKFLDAMQNGTAEYEIKKGEITHMDVHSIFNEIHKTNSQIRSLCQEDENLFNLYTQLYSSIQEEDFEKSEAIKREIEGRCQLDH